MEVACTNTKQPVYTCLACVCTIGEICDGFQRWYFGQGCGEIWTRIYLKNNIRMFTTKILVHQSHLEEFRWIWLDK